MFCLEQTQGLKSPAFALPRNLIATETDIFYVRLGLTVMDKTTEGV
jgi:hypothetical protein